MTQLATGGMPQSENTRLIPLTQGQFAIVDAADFEWLNRWKWTAEKHKRTYYAQRRLSPAGGKQQTIRMHCLIMGLSGRVMVDHRDGNGLNNCRSNLRAATKAQNNCNQHMLRRNNKSGFLGVSWCSSKRRWLACLTINGKQKYVGIFVDPVEAARARDAAARKFYGEFASLNFK